MMVETYEWNNYIIEKKSTNINYVVNIILAAIVLIMIYHKWYYLTFSSELRACANVCAPIPVWSFIIVSSFLAIDSVGSLANW